MSLHIKDGAHFAKTVLMPGDPYRAKYIAENYLEDPVLVTEVRGILGYTGKTKSGKEISVMASGMGVPSIGIYSHELYTQYGVEEIIRIGTAGAYQKDIHVGDLILVSSACSNSSYASQFDLKGAVLAPVADFNLLLKMYNLALKEEVKVHVGSIFSSDIFYDNDKDYYKNFQKLGVLGVEMESYGLFINAMKLNKKAGCILTVSDSFENPEEKLSVEERQTKLGAMFEIALKMVD
ncbi:MAG TPA: purine-nucleoside phosphorylase [Candidatus Onthovivens sp.]|nr:purine-nucleoside phosphorylase [Candidatus Onthovivens sp.]